jgi:ATP-dependent helicase/nuclease subunit B
MASVRFILGRAGSGKTRHLVEQITALCRRDPLGPPIYWLLPKQATFQAERLLTVALGGFARVRVIDFGQLGQTVLDACGDVGMPEVTPPGRRMVIGHLLRSLRGRLTYYNHAAHRPGLAAELDATFAEFERAGLDHPALTALIDTLDPADDPAAGGLRQKLSDVALLLAAYNAHVGTEKLDPKRRLDLVLKEVANCRALAGATLFVDGFYDVTAYERKLLAAVAAVVDRAEIALLLDPDDPAASDFDLPPSDLSVFHRTLRAYRGLRVAMRERGLSIEPPLILRGMHGRTANLTELERGLFAPDRLAGGPARRVPRGRGDIDDRGPQAGRLNGGAIDFFDAPDARAEVDAVARQIRAAVADGTVRFRDVAVLVRSLSDYREIVHASFGEHGIGYFADHRRSAVHHPLLQVVRASLLVARNNWPHEATMTLAKSGLVGLDDDQADALENYVLQHRIRGRSAWESAEPWAFVRDLTRREDDPDLAPADAATIDDLRHRLADPLAPLLAVARGGPATVKGIATALFQALEAFKVRSTLARWMATADAERRGEHEQVWAELTTLFDQMVDVIGEARVTVAQFLDVLDSGLEGFDLAIAPPTVDQVLLGEVDRTRTPPVKLVFVLGLTEGRFPGVDREELVLSDAERRSLRRRQVDLDEDTERRLLDERFLAYVAFTRPTEQLVVSRPLADDAGRAANPSVFWYELHRLCPTDPTHVPRSSADDPQTIGTPRQLVDALMRWVTAGAPAGDGVLPALYQWLAEAKPDGTAIDTMRYRAWRALSYRNDAHLDPAHAAELFPLPLHATVRQLEDANACPFRHFVKYGLLLTQREADDVTGLDLNNAYHQVVENLTRDLLARKTDWCTLDPAAARELIRTHAAEVGRQLRGELMLSSARNRYLLDHIERTLERAVACLSEVTRRGKYRPRWANLRFGNGHDAELPPHEITTPAHRTVHLHGRIDRVDLNDRGTAFTVADYKLGPAALSLDKVYHGLSLQLLTYLLVVRAGGERLANRKIAPAAAFLLGLLSSPRLVPHPDDALSPDDAEFHLRQKPRGLIDDRAVDSLDGCGGETGASKVVAAYRKKDGTFGNRQNTDVATAAEFNALLAQVERRLGQAADRVVDGSVEVRPYMLGRQTPCPRCEYRTVCRFEPGVNTYRILQPMRREDVLTKVVEGEE